MQGGIVGWGLLAVAALSYTLFVVTYIVFRRWVRDARGARLAIYYNRRPVVDFSFEEYLVYARMLNKDEASKGRIMYTGGKMRVVLIRRGVR